MHAYSAREGGGGGGGVGLIGLVVKASAWGPEDSGSFSAWVIFRVESYQ